MSVYERRAWIMLITAVPTYLTYLAIVLSRSADTTLTEVEYRWPALIVIGAAIALNILLEIIGAMVWSAEGTLIDERDRSIDRLGERAGVSFVLIASLAAMLMAMFEWDWFWIGNVLILGFVLSAMVGSISKVAAYRW